MVTSASTTQPLVACLGDAMVKIIHRTGVDLVVHTEVPLDRKPSVGDHLAEIEFDDKAEAFACSSTDGYLYVHQIIVAPDAS